MKLINSSEQFVVKFNGSEYTIPKGEFEVINERLGSHIISKSHKWNKDVRQVSSQSIDIIQPVAKKEEIKAPIEQTFSGASMDTVPKKQGRPKKNVVEQIA